MWLAVLIVTKTYCPCFCPSALPCFSREGWRFQLDRGLGVVMAQQLDEALWTKVAGIPLVVRAQILQDAQDQPLVQRRNWEESQDYGSNFL